MKIKYPHPIPPRGTIGVTAPASPVDATKLNRGVKYLNEKGYKVEVGKSCYQKKYYVAGSDRERADEFMDFIRNPDIDAIICARGGYGSMRLLPYLNFQDIRKHAKLFIGFSDITALQWAIWAKSRLVTLSAGMVATDMGESIVNSAFESSFWQLLEKGNFSLPLDYTTSDEQHIKGHLLPGTLSVGIRLLGTSYFPTDPSLIPVLEDINEPTHKLEGHLLHLKLSSFYEKTSAVLFGQFTPAEYEEYDDHPSYEEIISYVFDDLKMPVITGLSYGHISEKIPLPVGAPISLYLGSNSHLTIEDIYNHP